VVINKAQQHHHPQHIKSKIVVINKAQHHHHKQHIKIKDKPSLLA
jgi:hypothetical protein